MVKTHEQSRFSLLTLSQIRSSDNVILQVTETNSVERDTKHDLYLCEVVSSYLYKPASIESVSAELIRVNKERDRLQRKVERLEKIIRDHERNCFNIETTAGGDTT